MFRRSVKSNPKPQHLSIPNKDPLAIVPPKKVIKALYDYRHDDPNPNSGYLSFSQGDFLHVIGRENDTDWYEACNPLQQTRGLVPVSYFEGVGKQVRDSGGSAKSTPNTAALPNNAPHDSGYSELPPNGSNENLTSPKPMRLSRTLGKGTGALVYGVVMYDFKAERPDELEAKEGEAIIVIAQSNPEWFVAKPITRLGGPGLIPVSFIEIRDMTSGKAVQDPHEAVRRAGVPKVEEWKKMAADYKNGSIPLGKLDAQKQMQQGMERMSMNGRSPSSPPANNPPMSASYNQTGFQQPQQSQESPRRSSPGLLAPMKAVVPRYCFADDIFWFIIECQMEDGRHWELSRLYQDFYDLQINLIQEFPLEAGNVQGVERSLPYMPGPVTYVTDNISNGRRANLDEYIKNLLKLGPHITKGHLVRKFFAPRQGDYEIDPSVDEYRLSQGSEGSDPSGASGQSSAEAFNQQNQYYNDQSHPAHVQHQRAQSSLGGQQQHGQAQHNRATSDLAPPPMLRNNSAWTQASASSSSSVNGVRIKLKVDNGTNYVIRLNPPVSLADLERQLEGRLGTNNYKLEYESSDASFTNDGQFRWFIETDEQFLALVDQNPKLALNVLLKEYANY